MTGKIRDHFKGESGKATTRSFVAGVAAQYIAPLAASIVTGLTLPIALACIGGIGLYTAAARLNHKAERKAGRPAGSSSYKKDVLSWFAGCAAGFVLTSFFGFTPAQKHVTSPAPKTSVTEIAPGSRMNLNKSLAERGLRLPALTVQRPVPKATGAHGAQPS